MANRGRLRLDADGFSRTSEERYDDQFSGKRLYDIFLKDPLNPQAGFRPGTGFWNPGGKEYLLPLPRQFNPTWFKDPRLVDHVLKAALWTFTSGLTVQTFSPSHAHPFGPSYPANEWMVIHTGTATGPSLDSRNYTAIGQACGNIIFPAGMKTLAVCGQTPPSVGTPLGSVGYENLLPYFQTQVFPAPDNTVVFGWSNFCVVLFGTGGYLLRNPNGDKATWERLAWWNSIVGPHDPSKPQTQQSGFASGDFIPAFRGFLVSDLGERDYWVSFSHGGGTRVPWRSAVGPTSAATGPWWIAGPTATSLIVQVQIAGYEGTHTAGNRPILFDFPQGQAPTQPPVYELRGLLHANPGDITVSHGAGGYTYTSPAGAKITYMLQDAVTLMEWVSDGIAHRGTLYLSLFPANFGLTNAGYLAPQVKLFEFSFPAHIVPRTNSEFILLDTEFDRWGTEASYYDCGQGQIRVFFRVLDDIGGAGGLALESGGYHERFGFPIVYEETAEVGPPDWVPRWRAWAETFELDELASEDDASGLRHYLLKAKPMLHRAQQKWTYPPRIFNPAAVPPGTVEHTFAIAATLRSSHFDTTDPDQVSITADPASGTERARLPGTWGTEYAQAAPAADPDDDAWGPTWSEQRLAYMQRIATDWAGWVLYTDLLGEVYYHPDLPQGLAAGEWLYYAGITLYRRIQDAAAAGVNRMQVYAETGYLLIRPKGNVVTVYGKDDEGKVVRAIARDNAAITDLTNPNFSGEENAITTVARLAVGDSALTQLAFIKLRRDGRKRVIRRFKVDLAPWELEGGVSQFDVGHVFTAAGRGTFVCIHLSVEGKHRGLYETIITGERIPVGSVEGALPGPFPGSGDEEIP